MVAEQFGCLLVGWTSAKNSVIRASAMVQELVNATVLTSEETNVFRDAFNFRREF